MAKKTDKPTTEDAVNIQAQTEQEKILIHSQVSLQKDYFKTNATRPISWRVQQLKKLYSSVKKHEEEILSALQLDLGKSAIESYITEIGPVVHEITLYLKNIKKWSKPEKTDGDRFTKTSKGTVTAEPYGTVLILSPWSAPFLLAFKPLIAAIASGNTVVLKPSEASPETNKIMDEIIQECFPAEYIFFVQPGYMQNQILLREQFDFIFFTGSSKTGKQVMESASKFLTPVCLALGGKNPCIVDETANISAAARKIIWGKLLNAGQNCMAPDYVLVHESEKEHLINSLHDEIEVQYGEFPLKNENYPKIVNTKHFSRLFSMVPDTEVDTSTNKILPTILELGDLFDKTVSKHPTMQEEIFGPILPIISYKDLSDVVNFICERPSPLALYLFTQNKGTENQIFNNIRFGSGCLNDVAIQQFAESVPINGIGDSGFGSVNGKNGFRTFSHYKSVLIQSEEKEKRYRFGKDKTNLTKIKKIF